ncbi:hypothetical protein L083_4440 [Actinoplanes sp. N902-109]|nr:hypothetical protein L083_4440 [Actinoplanes sp. N902-109]
MPARPRPASSIKIMSSRTKSGRRAPACFARRHRSATLWSRLARCAARSAGLGSAAVMASTKPRLRALSSASCWTIRHSPRHGSGSAQPSWTIERHCSTSTANAASISVCLVGKRRYSVAGPTPARRATSRIGTSRPRSANSSRAASSTRSRLSRASERSL